MNLRLIPLASSSKANSTAIVAGGLVIVADAGIPRREIVRRLNDEGVLTAEKPRPDALLLTHEHTDHAAYVTDWLAHDAPIFCSPGTANRTIIERSGKWRRARPLESWRLGPEDSGVVATSIMVSHDASEPVAWRVAHGGRAAIIATDLGCWPVGWDLFCRGATDMLIEANYHRRLLESCDYPAPLKLRIASDHGHMDVEHVAEWIKTRMPSSVENLYLGHISRKCCDPRIVRHLAAEAIGERPVKLKVLEK